MIDIKRWLQNAIDKKQMELNEIEKVIKSCQEKISELEKQRIELKNTIDNYQADLDKLTA